MKIIVAHNCFSLYWRPRLDALATALCDRGDSLFEVAVGTPHSRLGFIDQEDHLKGNCQWIRLFDKDAQFVTPKTVYKALWRTLDNLKPDVILAGPIAFTVGVAALAWSRSRGAGIVIMDNARVEDVPRSALVNFVKRRLHRNVDAMLLPAESHAKSYAFWGVPRERMFYGLNTADNEWFAKHAEIARNAEQDYRRALGLPSKYFLGIGRQVAKKNWGALIESYACYRRRVGEEAWDLVLVGDGPYREDLEIRSKQLGVRGIHFAPFCRPRELCVYYGLAQCFVLPSYEGETWGLVVNEAMACDLPVLVSSQCGCAKTLVRNDLNGWTFSPHDSQQLANLLEKMASLDAWRLAEMGKESKRIISEWGLLRFTKGAIEAIACASTQRRRKPTLLDSLLIKVWKGRYRWE